VPNGIAALTADGTNFYAATYSNVYAFNRASGNQDGQWTMPTVNAANSSDADLVSMAAAGGRVFVSVTQGNTVSVYRIDPSSSARPHLLVRGLGDAIAPDGSVYYERSDRHLAVLRPSGSTAVGPALADAPNGSGGGVQYVDVVADDAVWVSEPAGQGLDAQFTTYSTATLAQVGSYSGSVTSSVVDSATGPIVLETAGGGSCAGASPASCVARIDPHGAVSDPVPVGAAVTLIGPGPAVVVADNSTGQFDLVRLS
jgi:outer membrane protein assembly factor BamB